MKKLLLTLGSAATAIAPVATVVACGEKDEFDSRETFHKNSLTNEDLVENIERYIDTENKMLLWDNIEEDGFDSVSLDKDSNWPTSLPEPGDDWLSNTDMDIPSWVRRLSDTFHGAIINNHIHIPKAMVNEWYDLLDEKEGTRWEALNPHFTEAFRDSVIKNGITFEEGIKYIPAEILQWSDIENSGDSEYEIHIPSSVEYIGRNAFSGIKTDVINYDFSHLTKWYIDEKSHGMFGSSNQGLLSGVEIILPLFSRDLPEEFILSTSIFAHSEGEAPNLVKYNSVIDWTYAEQELFITDPNQIGWSNIY